MNNIKRPALLAGLCITTFFTGMFVLSQIIVKEPGILVNIIFWVQVVILLINISSFYTVNLSAKEFKEKRYLPWLSFWLTFIYECYYLAVLIVNVRDGMNGSDALIVAIYAIMMLGLLLYLPGILKKIVDNKLSYEYHSKKNTQKLKK